MEIFEIAGFQTGVDKSGVNFLQAADSYQNIQNGFIYRQILQSRRGHGYFAPRLNPTPVGAPPTVITSLRVYGIFEHTLPTGLKELLAFDANFLYKYNTGTGVFDQIPFAGSMVNYSGFNITDKSHYISGVSYPTATNGARFVFTGYGITAIGTSSIFFYNGTDVRDFTSVADNPNYQAPALGALNKARYVLWFNERINFISPTINGIDYTQGTLYSGIRTASGNGDKFNVAGSGMFQADTYQDINGASILGQIIVLNLDRSNYTLEKTRDAFNPYFGRLVPGVLGTDAKYSAVSWNDSVKSIGKTGIITTDGRSTARNDNKIPNFTGDDIDQILFDLTYGGFDRINNQFFWSYKISESESDTQDSVLVYNYEENTWSVYDQRFSVFGQTDLGLNLTWDDIDETTGNESWAKWDTTEEIWDKIGLGVAVQKTLAGDDLGFIYELNQDFDDYYTDISAITQANPAVLTVSPSAFLPGDEVIIKNVAGMVEINNLITPYIVTASTDTSITINQDSSLFTAYTSGGSISKVINFQAETIPFNPYREQGARCYMSHIEFLIDVNGGFLEVDIYSDEEQAPFKQNILLLPSETTTKSREWITITVNEEANFFTIVMRQKSVNSQVKLTSMRLHTAKGGLTSG